MRNLNLRTSTIAHANANNETKKAKLNSRHCYCVGGDHRHWRVPLCVNRNEIADRRASVSVNVGLAFTDVYHLRAANVSGHLGDNSLG